MELIELEQNLNKIFKEIGGESALKTDGKKYAWHPDAFMVKHKEKTFEINLECAHDLIEAQGYEKSKTIFEKYFNSYGYEITGNRPSDDFMSGIVEYTYEGKGYTQKMHILATDETDEFYPKWLETVHFEIRAEIQRNICFDLDIDLSMEVWDCMVNLLTLHD
jgi:hypothetical protein